MPKVRAALCSARHPLVCRTDPPASTQREGEREGEYIIENKGKNGGISILQI